MIHDVQLACRPGSEPTLRDFYGGVLGLTELPRPPLLAARGGAWFAGDGIELHLGVGADFRPARKAHPGLLWPDLDGLAARLVAAPSIRVDHAVDDHLGDHSWASTA